MTKDVEFVGLSSTPPDYNSPDGTLSASINLLRVRESLQPLVQGCKKLVLADNERLLLVHSVPGQKNYLIARYMPTAPNKFTLAWLEASDDENGGSITDTSAATSVDGTYSGFNDIAIIGNTIAMATDEGLSYFLWFDSKYIALGCRPPFIAIDFGLCETVIKEDEFAPKTVSFELPRLLLPGSGATAPNSTSAKVGYREAYDEFSMHLHGLLNSYSSVNISSNGYFWMPFFIRYAYRLYDGSYNYHSSPILMLPTAYPPKVTYSISGESQGHLGFANKAFTLVHRILSDGVEELKRWENIISGIDIFISAPIYTYDQSKNLNRSAGGVSVSPQTFASKNSIVKHNTSGIQESSGAHRGRSVEEQSESRASNTSFDGHYAARDRNDTAVAYNSQFIDHPLVSGDGKLINIQPHEKFTENLMSCHSFYKIAEIDIKDIAPMSDVRKLRLIDNDLTNLVTRETLPDDFNSHCALKPNALFSYNNRLSMANVVSKPAPPLPIRSLMAMSTGNGLACQNPTIKVWVRSGGKKILAVNHPAGTLEANVFYDSNSSFPRWLYYPDPNAYKMEIYCSDRIKYVINLRKHDFLNGAYYYGGLKPNSIPENVEEETDPTENEMELQSVIYTSEINNPFVFPAKYATTAGNGVVIALSSASKALSQGQFGQFPLYAFTTEGVWALELSSSGVFIARQPVTRDVCLSKNGICQLDSSVLFTTARGVMRLSGSQTECVSEAIAHGILLDTAQLPYADKLLAMAFPAASNNLAERLSVPFRKFLDTCQMTYDYPNQLVFAFSKDYPYTYVLSLQSGQWGMTLQSIHYSVNAYPEALVVNSAGELLDLSKPDVSVNEVPVFMMTRPFTLGHRDLLKTIETVIMRGVFSNTEIPIALYGSRDLIHWHLVRTSQKSFLRGFSGTPYKAFRLAALSTGLNKDNSISSFSTSFKLRRTNALR